MFQNSKYAAENTCELQFDFDVSQMADFNEQRPTGFKHNLMDLDIFSFDALLSLADRYQGNSEDYFITSGAASPSSAFYSTGYLPFTPREALNRLNSQPIRVLLKRPEKYDTNFAKLLFGIHSHVARIPNGPSLSGLVRLETAVLISSAATITPFHFDPEFGFFSQIEGNKIYHVYAPAAVREEALERFFVHGVVNIGRLELADCDPQYEHVFALTPGTGFYQPHNAPHWVETADTRSISYTFVFQNRDAAALGRVRAFNHYARKIGLAPPKPGLNLGRDAAKASVMRVVTPARRAVRRAVSAFHL